jgi:hypothetical protein
MIKHSSCTCPSIDHVANHSWLSQFWTHAPNRLEVVKPKYCSKVEVLLDFRQILLLNLQSQLSRRNATFVLSLKNGDG